MEKPYKNASSKDDPVGILAEDLMTQAFERMVAVLSPDPEKITHGSTYMLTAAFRRYVAAHQALIEMAGSISKDPKIVEEITNDVIAMVKDQLKQYGEVAEKILRGEIDGN